MDESLHLSPPSNPFDAPPSVVVDVEPAPAPRSRRKWLVGAGIATVLVLGAVVAVVAFGGSGTSEAKYSLKAATASAASATNVAYEMTMHTEATGDVTASGRLDSSNKLMAMEMTIPGLGSGPIEVVFDLGESMMYFRAGALGQDLGGIDTEWVAFDLSAMPAMGEVFDQAGTGNPLDVAKVFDGAASVTDLGVEDFRGEQVKHYNVTVDTADALAAYPALAQQIEAMGDDFPATMSYDVWITSDSTLRRVMYTLDVAGQEVSADIVYTAVGDIEPIVVPAPDDVTDLTEAIGGG